MKIILSRFGMICHFIGEHILLQNVMSNIYFVLLKIEYIFNYVCGLVKKCIFKYFRL
jgi:hypothetical protein